MKQLYSFLFLLAAWSGASQKVLERTEIDSWPKESKIDVPADFNRVSSYLIILNNQKYLELFNGVEYTKDERSELGIKKNDKPDLLQMSIEIVHPRINTGTAFTVPLFMYDFRDKDAAKTFSNYNGKILSNIKVDEIDSDIMGSIKVHALISNASTLFWKEVAKISADFGKSASSLALGNPLGMTELTGTLQKYIGEGITALGNLSNGQKIEDHSFFVKLIDKGAGGKFDEIVTSARLYQIHWSQFKPIKFNYFQSINTVAPSAISQFEVAVNSKEVPMVLVIETRSRTQINNIKPQFTEDYKQFVENEYDAYPIAEHQMFKDYSRNYSTAYNIVNYLKSFDATVNTSNIDWSSLLNSIDQTYQYQVNVKEEIKKYTSTQYSQEFKNRYELIGERYNEIDFHIIEMYRNVNRNIYKETADKVIEHLLNPLNFENTTLTNDQVYDAIKVLSQYENLVNKISSDASTFKSNASYRKYKELRTIYEEKLYSKRTLSPPSSNGEKLTFYKNIREEFPLCVVCITKASTRIDEVNHRNESLLIEAYNSLSEQEFSNFNGCRKTVEKEIINAKQQIGSLEEYDRKIADKTILELENNINIWKDNIGKDTKGISGEQIALYNAAIYESRKKIKACIQKLVELNIFPILSCLQ